MEFMSKLEMQNEIDKYKKQLAEKSRRLEVLDAEKLDWIAAGERQDAELKDWKDTVVNLKMALEQRDEEIEALTECLNGSSKATYTAEVFDKMRAEKDEIIVKQMEAQLESYEIIEAKDRIIKACGEALERIKCAEYHKPLEHPSNSFEFRRFCCECSFLKCPCKIAEEALAAIRKE